MSRVTFDDLELDAQNAHERQVADVVHDCMRRLQPCVQALKDGKPVSLSVAVGIEPEIVTAAVAKFNEPKSGFRVEQDGHRLTFHKNT